MSVTANSPSGAPTSVLEVDLVPSPELRQSWPLESSCSRACPGRVALDGELPRAAATGARGHGHDRRNGPSLAHERDVECLQGTVVVTKEHQPSSARAIGTSASRSS